MEETRKYLGRVARAKDALLIETRMGNGTVSLGCPADFVDSCLEEFTDEEVLVEIQVTVKIKKQQKQNI